jgi:polar amino acid transport system ATP-binding protein
MNNAVPMVSMRGVGASFGTHRVLHAVDLDVMRGEVVALIGPSGSGKTTLLRCMNFLTPHDTGEVFVQGARLGFDLTPDGRRLPQNERTLAEVRAPLAMVFQQFNLWPHMTALGNVMAPLTIARGLPAERAKAMALDALDRVGLSAKAHLHPTALSGGQQQRVGIARALAGRPEAMLLDEPTSALDPELVGEVLDVIRTLRRDGMTMVMVTHEMGFAAQVASRIVFMEQGAVVTQGSPDDVIRRPTHPRVQAFLQPWVARQGSFA